MRKRHIFLKKLAVAMTFIMLSIHFEASIFRKNIIKGTYKDLLKAKAKLTFRFAW